MSSTCFETKGSSSGQWLHVQVWYSVFYMLYHTLYHTCIYNRLPEDELSVEKHVEDIKKLKY